MPLLDHTPSIKSSRYTLLPMLLLVVNIGLSTLAEGQDDLAKILSLPQLSGQDELPAPNRPAVASESTPAPQPSERIYLGLEADQAKEGIGVDVAVVTRDSPAWKAGFKTGDRILGINGFAIGTMQDMIDQLGKTKPGQSVNFLINREGRNSQLVAVLMSAEVADQIQSNPTAGAPVAAWLGMTAHDVTPSFRDQFGIGAFRGAAVTQVVSGSPAYQAGIRAGDAVIEAGGRSIESAADLQKWVEQSKPGEQSQVVFYRGAARQTAKIVLARDPSQQVVQKPSRPPAFPKKETLAGGNAKTEPTGPLAGGPLLPNTGVGPLPPERNNPLVLRPDPDPNMPVDKQTEREKVLEEEVVKLRQELADAQQKLAETKKQLDNILRALKD